MVQKHLKMLYLRILKNSKYQNLNKGVIKNKNKIGERYHHLYITIRYMSG